MPRLEHDYFEQVHMDEGRKKEQGIGQLNYPSTQQKQLTIQFRIFSRGRKVKCFMALEEEIGENQKEEEIGEKPKEEEKRFCEEG